LSEEATLCAMHATFAENEKSLAEDTLSSVKLWALWTKSFFFFFWFGRHICYQPTCRTKSWPTTM